MHVSKVPLKNKWEVYKSQTGILIYQIQQYKKLKSDESMDEILDLAYTMEIDIEIGDEEGLLEHILDIYVLVDDNFKPINENVKKIKEFKDKLNYVIEEIEKTKIGRKTGITKEMYEMIKYMKKVNSA